jgi:hypothetical protein
MIMDSLCGLDDAARFTGPDIQLRRDEAEWRSHVLREKAAK